MHSVKFNFVKSVFAMLALTLAFGAPASAATSRYQVLLNLDNNTSTGCTVPTLTGTFPGVEQILITTVDTTGSSAQVSAVETRACTAPPSTFGAATPIPAVAGHPLPWPVGVSNGTGGTSVIETFYPLSVAPSGPSPIIRLGVLSFDASNTLVDEMVQAQPGPGNGPPILLQIQGVTIGEIPTLSEWGLILLALTLAVLAVALMKRRTRAAFLVALILLAGAGLAWAAACDLNGTTSAEWIPSTLLATDNSDSAAGADLRAFYGCRDAGLNGICFRIDALLLFNQTPTANDQNVATNEDTPVAITLTGSDPDADPLTFSIVTPPAHGTLTGTAPNVTYTPNADYNGPDSFTFQVDDGVGGTDTGTVSITVNGADDPPTAVNDAATVAEDSGATPIPVLANDTDPDAGPISIASVTQPANGTVVITGGGTGLTYQPNPNYCNTPPGTTLDTFTYTLTPASATPTATVTMTVTCVNDAPVANDDAAAVTEDAAATAVPVLANDTDVEGDPFTIASVTQPANGTVVITGGGTGLTYQPSPNYCNTPPGSPLDTFTYTLTPGGDSATVSMTVNCVNDNPVAVADSATVAEDAAATAVPVLANDTDVEGDPFTISAVTQPANGTVVITGGGTGLTYQPNANYCNQPPGSPLDTFTYTLTPGGSSTTVTMTVTCVDDAPVAVADAATVAEDSGATAVPVLANDTDIDGGPKTIASVTQPANGTVVITGGGTGLTYQPNANYCNSVSGPLDTFTYTLTPGGSSATVSMTVTCADDNPVAVADAATVAEDAAATAVPVLANDTDVDGGPISISSVTQPANGTVVITGGGTGLTYQPNANYCNSVLGPLDTFTYTLTPGGSSATVSMTVTCVDDNPVAVADAATVAEDSGANPVAVLANDTDVDGGPISISAVTQPANGTVVITGGGTGLTYTPNANYCNSVSGTPDTFTYTLTPGGSSTTVSMTVTCVDDNPVAVADAATVAEDSGANPIPVLANDLDVDGGPISVAAVTQPANGTVVITGGGTGLTYTPNANYCNTPPGTTPDTFTYMLTPGGSSATVTVAVTCLNDAPAIDLDADDSQGTTGANFTVTFTEGDAAKLIEDPVDATVTDVDNTTLASLTVTITNLLDTGFETLSADVTGTSITAAYVTAPGTGTLTLTGPDTLANFRTVLRKVRYVNTSNAPNTSQPRAITFVANDGASNSNTATSTVTVVSVDTPPTAVADSATVNEDSGATAVPVLANDTDPDGGPISIQSVTQPANGTVVITGGGSGLTYQPNANYCGSDSFTYTLTPGGSSATVSMTVTCVDDNPVAVADSATVLEDSGATAIPVLANDTDVDGGPISIQSVTQPANGTVVITGGGTGLTYAPNANYCNTPPGTTLSTFTYTLTPGGSSTTVTVTVTCVDDNPVAVADSATVVEDSSNNAIPVLTNDTDVDGGPISVTSVTQPANGSVVITGGGTGVSYTPNPNYCNTPPGSPLDTFTYTLTPGGSSATVSVAVTCVDDPPVAVADSATVVEDSGANAIPVLANDTDIDAGPKSISAVTQPANGTVVITGGGSGLTYAPNANYCNSISGTPETFTYTLTPGGSSTTVTITVTCVNDPPVADNDTFDFIGNTDLVVDLPALATPHARETTTTGRGVLDGDSDPVEGDTIMVSSITVGACTDNSAPFDCTDPAVGRVQMQADGQFTFTPAPGDTGATETFTYVVTDNGVPAPASTTATVTLTRFERVWYVDPAGGAGNGTSSSPFNALTSLNGAGGAGDSDLAGDYIFIHAGTLAGSIELEANQHLLGKGVGLSIPVNLNGNGSPTNLVAAGTQPQVTNASGNTVTATGAVPIEIRGLSLASTTANAIDLTSTAALTGSATLTISSNEIRGAGAEGVDINLNAGTTGTLAVDFNNNTWNAAGTHTGNGFDARTAAAGANLRINFSNNSNILATGAAAAGVFIDGSAGGSLVVTGFANNTVHQNTAGSGIIVNSAKFDSNAATAAYDQVSGGATLVGISGNGVGGAGINMSTVSGDLAFTDLDIFADGGLGLRVAGTGAVNTGAGTGTRFTVGTGVAIFEATGGPAVDASSATIDLQPTSIRSTNSTTTGVALNSVTGTFSAGSGSTISGITGAGGTAFQVGNSNATVSYAGTINSTVGTGVSLTSNTGSTIGFTGALTLSTGTSSAFVATGGGTVTSTNTTSTLTTTTGTALNVANTTIGAGGLQFRSITANGGANGIVLDNTGASGGLTVAGTGSAGTGGTIRNMTGADGATAGTGIYLNNTRNVSLAWMQLNDFQNFAIRGQSVVGFSLTNSTINGVNGNNDAANEGSISFDELTGSATLTSVNVSGGWEDNFRLANTTGTLNRLTLTGCNVGANSATFGNNALNLMASGTATVNVTVTGSTFTGSRSHHIQYLLNGNATPSGDLVLTSNTITQSMAAVAGAGNIFVSSGGNGNPTLTYNIQNNTMRNAVGNAINVSKGAGTGSFNGTIDNNMVGVTGVANSGSSQGNGIVIIHVGGGTHTTHITNNAVRRFNNDGILVQVGDNTSGGNGTVNATITGNVVKEPDSFALHGLELNIGTTAGDSHFVCASIGGAGALRNDLANSSVVANGGFEIRPRQRQSTTIRLPGYAGGATDTAAVATFLAGQNTTSGVGSISASAASNGFVNGAACP